MSNRDIPAFPSPGVVLPTGQQGAYEGMFLRDYFAAQAMQIPQMKENFGWMAERAYQMADAMLKARML